jgi:DNA-binding IclR family transcriptional regulator
MENKIPAQKKFRELVTDAATRRILEVLEECQPLNVATITARLGSSPPTTRKYLRALVDRGEVMERELVGGVRLYSITPQRPEVPSAKK